MPYFTPQEALQHLSQHRHRLSNEEVSFVRALKAELPDARACQLLAGLARQLEPRKRKPAE